MRSHHTHSGDYVSHASDTLETVCQRAIDMGFQSFCLTEHQPRLKDDFLYPEEKSKSYNAANLSEIFANYYKHARIIQQRNLADPKVKTKFLVGFEVEAIDGPHIDLAVDLLQEYQFDMCVGSVHFIKSIPIDFDKELWEAARAACGGAYELFSEYFEIQYLMLQKIKPAVVGHFDLIYLMCDESVVDKRTGKKVKTEINIQKDWPQIWEKVIRNVKFIKSYGGLFELNSASLRKGWATPYPGVEIAKAICEYGDARFCFSDDCHSIAQVGLNYHRVLKYADEILNLEEIYFIDLDEKNKPIIEKELLSTIKKNDFWKQYEALEK
ncbi:histidinol-phosphatase [Saccharomycopsis crataegensis]|uniref:Histidinol-phosphatase n=1 Tax=Saccharomycopsis crataegensis TaxID=43959 RepID=A0AAV5QP89_9ASCO|nr:histidinol-phosphatase [Saccharomycopsis crataegensis]